MTSNKKCNFLRDQFVYMYQSWGDAQELAIYQLMYEYIYNQICQNWTKTKSRHLTWTQNITKHCGDQVIPKINQYRRRHLTHFVKFLNELDEEKLRLYVTGNINNIKKMLPPDSGQ